MQISINNISQKTFVKKNKSITYPIHQYNTNMDNTTFKSTLKFVTPKQFNHQIERLDKKCCVSSPWTIQQSVVAPNVYTNGVLDCTVCLISDGTKALMIHRCPTSPQNVLFEQFSKLFEKVFNIKSPDLQAIVIGAKLNNNDSRSEKYFDEFVDYFEKNNIPCSQLKGSNFRNNILYRSDTDEVLISNNEINDELVDICTKNPPTIFNKIFEKIELSDCDQLE